MIKILIPGKAELPTVARAKKSLVAPACFSWTQNNINIYITGTETWSYSCSLAGANSHTCPWASGLQDTWSPCCLSLASAARNPARWGLFIISPALDIGSSVFLWGKYWLNNTNVRVKVQRRYHYDPERNQAAVLGPGFNRKTILGDSQAMAVQAPPPSVPRTPGWLSLFN